MSGYRYPSRAVDANGHRSMLGWTAPRHRVPELGCEQPRLEPSVTQYKRIAIDLSKAVFTLHGIDQQDRPVLRTNLRRAQMIPFFAKLAPTEIAMEACGGAHYWARELIMLGHKVRMIPPQYVKPYVKRGKNDRNDAEAICEAAGRPGMQFVPVKSVTQQAQGMVLKVRETLVAQRTLLVNTLRGHAAEFGVIAGNGISKIGPLLLAIEQETAIPLEAKEMAVLLGQQIADLDSKITAIEVKLSAAHKANEVSQRLATIPGVGPVTALTLAIEIDPAAFESGRHLAAWAGLTPKEHSTGGKQRMGEISRAGNERLRALLVTGATSVIKAATKPGSKQMTDWLRAILSRKPRKVVAVALANKMARVAWALMTRGEVYRRSVITVRAVVA
jgi:transposase